jgi:hypothetical protein
MNSSCLQPGSDMELLSDFDGVQVAATAQRVILEWYTFLHHKREIGEIYHVLVVVVEASTNTLRNSRLPH